MIKIPIAFLFTLSFSHLTSCNIKKTPAISTLHIDNLTYSSYRWRHSKADTGSELFIDNYLFINGDGKYLVMRHAAAFEPAQYFKGSIGDSMIDLIEKALNKKWDSTYFNPEPRIYDGNSYDLNYVTNGQQKNILFIPGDSPPILQDLSSKLDSIIFNSNISSGVFSLEKYSKILTKRSLANSGGLPILQSPNIEIK